MAVLKGMSDEVAGVVHDLTESETTIGRHESNVISIDHLSVSAFHCSIVKDGEKYTMRDMDSTNGTRVDNQKVGVRRLSSGNMVHIGAVEFMFEGASATASGVAPVTARWKKVDGDVAIAKKPSSSADHSGFKTSGGMRGKTVMIVLGVIGVFATIGALVLFVILSRMGR